MVHVIYTDNSGGKGNHELDSILSGEKTMVIRSAAGRKIPHSRVFTGDVLYFMEKGSLKISATAIATDVKNYVKLSEDEINEVFKENENELNLTAKQKDRWHKKCICLVAFEKVQRIEPALDFEKQSNMDDWIIIEKIEDVLIGSSLPFNYDKSKL